MSDSVTLWTAARPAFLSFSVFQSLLKFLPTESMMLSNHFILCRPFSFPCIRVFSSESVLRIRWPKYWSFSFSFSISISPSNEYSRLISSGINWFDLLAVQRALKSLLQHHCSKASILEHSTFFMAQLSHPYTII